MGRCPLVKKEGQEKLKTITEFAREKTVAFEDKGVAELEKRQRLEKIKQEGPFFLEAPIVQEMLEMWPSIVMPAKE